MAERRMLSKQIIDTDKFHQLSLGARLLYCMLVLHADDYGFVGNTACLMHAEGVQACDLSMLLHAGYVIPFESRVLVITDWESQNHIADDRRTKTTYSSEFQQLGIDENKRYYRLLSDDLQEEKSMLFSMQKTCSVKYSKVKCSYYGKHALEYATEDTQKMGRPASIKEVSEYIEEKKYHIDSEKFYNYYEANGWTKSRGGPITNWKAMIGYWESNWKSENHNAPSYDSDAFKQKAKTVSEYPNQNELLERIEDKVGSENTE